MPVSAFEKLSDMIHDRVSEARQRKQKVEDQERDNQMKIIMSGVQAHAQNGTLTDDMIQNAQAQMQKLVPKDSLPLIEGWNKVMGMVSRKRKQGQGATQAAPGQAATPNGGQPGQSPAAGAPTASGAQNPAPSPAPAPQSKPGMFPSAKEMGQANADRFSAQIPAQIDFFKRQEQAKAEIAAGEPKRMIQGLTDAGFSETEAKEIVRHKVEGRQSAIHWSRVKISDPADPTREIYGMQSNQPNENGEFPIYGTDGKLIGNPSVLVPSMLPTQRTGEMPVYNPVTNQFEPQPTYSSSQKVPPKLSGGTADKGSGGVSVSGSSSGGSKVTVPPGMTSPEAHKRVQSAGRHGIPARQFNILQKQATSVDEARASLVGDDPNNVGGIAADLGVFDNPESVKKISDYLGLVNMQLEQTAPTSGHGGTGEALSWYFGIPQKLIDLKQGALRDSYSKLSPEEQKFADDYYRVMGTIGGMRAATGASAARWSFRTLQAELPTPGPVTNREGANRRLTNLLNETKVVSKRNPLLNAPEGKNTSKSREKKQLTPDEEAEQYLAGTGNK